MGEGVEERTLLDAWAWLDAPVPGARGCVGDGAPSPRCGGPPWSWLCLCMEEVDGHGFLSSLIPERVAGVETARGSPPQCVGGCLVEEGSSKEGPGLVKGLSLICKSLLGRNQPHKNAISTQSLSQPLSCLRQKQFTQPPIKQGR